jgi:peptide-methionine (S)-S-oxide reductase
MGNLETAYFASGCFWGAERRFWMTSGVTSTSVGYMGGTTKNPSYELVCEGETGHAEIVEVIFDPSKVSYQELLELFWEMHDPTSYHRQGNDFGSQYRSAIFTTTQDQMDSAIASRDIYQAELTRSGHSKICTEILPADGVEYWPAESYHQRYLAKNPFGYDCHSSTGIPYPTRKVAL